MKEPAVGSYESAKSIDETQQKKIVWKFALGRRETYFDKDSKLKKFVPGVGTYEKDKLDIGILKLSAPPISMRRRR
jgi:hypothetical protein